MTGTLKSSTAANATQRNFLITYIIFFTVYPINNTYFFLTIRYIA